MDAVGLRLLGLPAREACKYQNPNSDLGLLEISEMGLSDEKINKLCEAA